MATPVDRVMSATEFKARCLEVMDDLATGRLERVTVTKRGRAVMEARGPATRSDEARGSAFGFMRGTVRIPEGLDLTQPLGDPDDWSALREAPWPRS
jgi:antitoxin (DNA-binding transcriptional repressor) of toxin-antitoxin stability system